MNGIRSCIDMYEIISCMDSFISLPVGCPHLGVTAMLESPPVQCRMKVAKVGGLVLFLMSRGKSCPWTMKCVSYGLFLDVPFRLELFFFFFLLTLI